MNIKINNSNLETKSNTYIEYAENVIMNYKNGTITIDGKVYSMSKGFNFGRIKNLKQIY